jgi:hypothetical protein
MKAVREYNAKGLPTTVKKPTGQLITQYSKDFTPEALEEFRPMTNDNPDNVEHPQRRVKTHVYNCGKL